MVNKMKVLTAGVKSSNKKSKKKKSSNNNTKQQQQSHSNTADTANNNDIESAAAAVDSSTNTVDNRLNTTPVNDNINGGHSIVGKFFMLFIYKCLAFFIFKTLDSSTKKGHCSTLASSPRLKYKLNNSYTFALQYNSRRLEFKL